MIAPVFPFESPVQVVEQDPLPWVGTSVSKRNALRVDL